MTFAGHHSCPVTGRFGGWFINRTGKIIASSPGALTVRVPQGTGTELQAFGETDPKQWTSFRRYYQLGPHFFQAPKPHRVGQKINAFYCTCPR